MRHKTGLFSLSCSGPIRCDNEEIGTELKFRSFAVVSSCDGWALSAARAGTRVEDEGVVDALFRGAGLGSEAGR